MPNKTPFPHRKWKSRYDDIITAILSGKTHMEAAAVVGVGNSHISRLMRWPPFTKEFRRRRALIIEDADAWIQAAQGMAAARQLEILNLNRPYVIEFKDKTGKLKKRTIPPNFHLVAQVAEQVRRMGHERMDKVMAEDLLERVEKLERKAGRKAE